MGYIYTVEYYRGMKKNKILPFATTWVDLKGVMLSEISHRERQILGNFPGSPVLRALCFYCRGEGFNPCFVLCAKSLQSCLTLCDPMDRSPPDSSEYWSGLPFPTPGIPDPGFKPTSLQSPAFSSGIFTWEAPVPGWETKILHASQCSRKKENNSPKEKHLKNTIKICL